jgi:hypothetical protein
MHDARIRSTLLAALVMYQAAREEGRADGVVHEIAAGGAIDEVLEPLSIPEVDALFGAIQAMKSPAPNDG